MTKPEWINDRLTIEGHCTSCRCKKYRLHIGGGSLYSQDTRQLIRFTKWRGYCRCLGEWLELIPHELTLVV